MNPFVKQNFGAPPPRHALGLWLNSRKLTSSAYVPNRFERAKLRDGEFYSLVVNWSLPGLATDYFKAISPARFALTSIIAQSSAFYFGTNESLKFDILDEASGLRLSDQPMLQNLFAGSNNFPSVINAINETVIRPVVSDQIIKVGAMPFFLPKPYFFKERSSIVITVQSTFIGTSSGQVVFYGSLLPS